MQRRLGSKVLWEVVSFTGRFRADYLTQVNNVRAPQPDVLEPDSEDQRERQYLKDKATRCRGDLRYAEFLDRKRQKGHQDLDAVERNLLKDFDSDKLRQRANDATQAFGHGRIKLADGTHIDIGANTGGAIRTFLDNWVPPLIPLQMTEVQPTADTILEGWEELR
jgi:hypothetical protein